MQSGLGLSDAYVDYDAEIRFGKVETAAEQEAECISGLVLRGERKPSECPDFGTRCTPERPLGVTMVSGEGACAAYYRYRRTNGSVGGRRMTSGNDFAMSCPLPAGDGEIIELAHGGGGRAMGRLLDTVIRRAFNEPILERRHDGAVLDLGGPIAFTTDSYVAKPLVFPSGDIGTLAVNGTINDLAMCGAWLLSLSVGFILDEGLPIPSLRRIAMSMREAAATAGVRLVTGDTKVVDRVAAPLVSSASSTC